MKKNKWEKFCKKKEIDNGSIIFGLVICIIEGFTWGYLIFA
jgi:hypothetical protein